MYLFFVTEPVELVPDRSAAGGRHLAYRTATRGARRSLDGTDQSLRFEPPRDNRVTEETLYFGFSAPFLNQCLAMERERGRSVVRVLADAERNRVLSSERMPLQFGHRRDAHGRFVPLESQLDHLQLTGPVRVAVINPFGFAFGDSTVLLTALRELHARLVHRFGRVELDILQHADNRETAGLYLRSGIVRSVLLLPLRLGVLARYHAYVDLSSDYQSHGLAWTDEMLEMLAIEPASVPAECKRNVVMVSDAVTAELSEQVDGAGSASLPLLLFHPTASTALRSMPDRVAERLIERLLARGDWTIVTTQALPITHPDVLDWAPLSTSFERWCMLVSRVDAILSVDTSVYHIADAFDVPGVVLFMSIAPEYRMRYYPGMRGIRLGWEGDRLTNKSESADSADLAFAASEWDRLDLEHLINVLDVLRPAARAMPVA